MTSDLVTRYQITGDGITRHNRTSDLIARYKGAGYGVTNSRIPAFVLALTAPIRRPIPKKHRFCNTKTVKAMPKPRQTAQGPVKTAFLPKARVQTKNRLEQAGIGHSPILLAICAANGVLSILRGYSAAFLPAKRKKTGYPRVSSIAVYTLNALYRPTPGGWYSLLPITKNIWTILMLSQ
ncbi:hypothetical protein [Mucilaginibacter paludis]|uniref:Uncharacterized protein n=1 Tax=Mucilaginibacter paludis DSM 18603 TaxID=714943 RepID=H1YCT0_9SPHI|nr:hypothetical protein [Mucilaginibacter paludis]EHQ25101.1 hypothetical protein Mucpa_0921 [Mucilaginibacter paludis DSM 18603]